MQPTCEIESGRIFALVLMRTGNVFIPQEALDQPCDVTLIVENGKEFKAHGQVLSKASPFFEKMLNSDMKEANEGIVRLEMVNESSLRGILEFIYTGSVQISTENNARELIAMADYFLLPEVKTIAGRILIRNLNVLNCISIYRFAEIYRCEKLISETKKFMLSNFTSVAKTEEFLNTMSIKEVEMWISSDEIDVNAEEDVFKFILSWIDRDEFERKTYFSQLFRHVRLVYVSRDFLSSDVVTNDLVKDTEGCLDLVKEALRLIDYGNYEQLFVTPRKSLEIPVIMGYLGSSCYFPRKDMWCALPLDRPTQYDPELHYKIVIPSVASHGRLYSLVWKPLQLQALPHLFCYDSFSNSWKVLPFKDSSKVFQMFVGSNEEIYALVADKVPNKNFCCNRFGKRLDFNFERGYQSVPCQMQHLFTITKYKPASNLWENITSSFLATVQAATVCIVANDNYLYFIGGRGVDNVPLTNAERFNLSNETWKKISDIQEPRYCAVGVAAHGKIFVTEGIESKSDLQENWRSCEMYTESSNEWQFIASLEKTPGHRYRYRNLVCADDQLYVVTSVEYTCLTVIEIECYDPKSDKWIHRTTRPVQTRADLRAYSSIRVFKRSKFLQVCTPGIRKCLVM